MKNFADDDSVGNFESKAVSAQTSEVKAPGARDVERRETNANRDRADGAGSHAPDVGYPAADARHSAEETGEEEIEVTPEMIRAGVRAMDLENSLAESFSDGSAAVTAVYRAMRAAK